MNEGLSRVSRTLRQKSWLFLISFSDSSQTGNWTIISSPPSKVAIFSAKPRSASTKWPWPSSSRKIDIKKKKECTYSNLVVVFGYSHDAQVSLVLIIELRVGMSAELELTVKHPISGPYASSPTWTSQEPVSQLPSHVIDVKGEKIFLVSIHFKFLHTVSRL